MAKQGQRAEVNTFIQGLITEASPLNFPPNASKREENFDLFRDGTRRRRLGMDYEEGYRIHLTSPVTDQGYPPFNKFLWEAAAGIPGNDLLVIQTHNRLDFFDSKGRPLTANGVGSIIFDQLYTRYSFASVDGVLVIANNTDKIYQVEYLGYRDFKVTTITLKMRDMWGVDTGDQKQENDVYYRAAELSYKQAYNLANQSWGVPRKDSRGQLRDPVSIYQQGVGKYPSDSEVVWTGLQFQAVVETKDQSQLPFERIYPSLYDEVFGLAPVAAKGYFIIDALARGPSRLQALKDNNARFNGIVSPFTQFTPTADTTPGGPSSLVSYAGRIFYSGFSGEVIDGDSRSPCFANYILFSQLVRNKKDIAKCYQDGDPSSRDGSDLVDTDGGYIKITGANRILAMVELGTDLVILADNGVWTVSGGNESGFSATNYKVTQVSTFGCSMEASIVTQGEAILYWGAGGIYTLSRDKFQTLVVQNITRTSIQKAYDDLYKYRSIDVSGVYDELNKKVRWLYKSGNFFDPAGLTYEVILDTELGSFTLNRIVSPPSLNIEIVDLVYVEDEMFYVTYIRTGQELNNYTVSKYRDKEFLDWKTNDGIGVDARAFVWTGDQVMGDSGVTKQVPYLIIHMERTEDKTDEDGVPLNQSSCSFTARWDWGNLDTDKHLTTSQQAYRYNRALFTKPLSTFNPGFDVVSTKNKVRGRGRALSLFMETEPGKDCHLLGWNVTLNGNAVV